MRDRVRRMGILLSLFMMSLVLACEPAREEIVHTTTAAEESPTTATALADPGTEEPAGGAVEVTLTEHRIEMPATLPAGPTTFTITNAGKAEHNFEVEGEGIETELPQNLRAGETGTLEIDLRPGTYHIYCPVANHEERGMSMELTVTEPSAAGTTSL